MVTSGFGHTTETFTVLLTLLLVLPAGSLLALTEAKLLTSGQAASVALASMVIDLLAPAATSPTLQVTFCPLVLQLAEVPVIVRPFGMVSVMVTLFAVLPPTLDASIVNVSESPEFTEVLLALFVTFTSG